MTNVWICQTCAEFSVLDSDENNLRDNMAIKSTKNTTEKKKKRPMRYVNY